MYIRYFYIYRGESYMQLLSASQEDDDFGSVNDQLEHLG